MTGAWRSVVFLSWAVLPLLVPHLVDEGVIPDNTPPRGAHSVGTSHDFVADNGEVSEKANPPRGAYDGLIESVAVAEGVDVDLVHAVITMESRYDRLARSPRGAQGLMQLMPETAARYAVSDPFDPAENIRGGTRHLRFLLEKFVGRVRLALAAYHAGEGAVLRHQGVPPFRETQHYISCVLAHYSRRASHSASPQRIGYYPRSRMLSKLDDPWPFRRTLLTPPGSPDVRASRCEARWAGA